MVPSAPEPINEHRRRYDPVPCVWNPTWHTRPSSSACARISSKSATDSTAGFSTSTSQPSSNAASTRSRCVEGGEETTTTSGCSSAASVCRSEYDGTGTSTSATSTQPTHVASQAWP